MQGFKFNSISFDNPTTKIDDNDNTKTSINDNTTTPTEDGTANLSNNYNNLCGNDYGFPYDKYDIRIKIDYDKAVLSAIKQDGMQLQYVKEQTPELCMIAVKQNSEALRYVRERNTRNMLSGC